MMHQRSTEWRQLRLGSVTASRFKDVMTEPRTKAAKEAGEWSDTARSYAIEKLTELVTCQPLDVWRSDATDWGTAQEPHAFELAVPAIQERFGEELILPEGDFAYIHHPTEDHVGCSPDGVIGDDGLLEVKCPYNPVNHLRTVLSGEMPKQHAPQVQGSLWICERKWYAFCSFDPRVAASGLDPLFVVRVERDDEYIERLAARVIAFRDWMMEEYERLIKKHKPF